MHAGRVLQTHCVSDIGKLAVFKDHKIVAHTQMRQLLDQIVIKVFNDVDMRLDEGDVRSDSLYDSEEFLLGCHVYAHTQI